MIPQSFKSNFLLPILLCTYIALYLAIMWPALNGPFLFDDFINLTYLKKINGELSHAHIVEYLLSFTGSPGRPISTLSFLINDYAWPSNPYSFKYTNLLIHLLNGVILFGLLRQLSQSSKKLPQQMIWPLVAMAAWVGHPLQVSAQMLVVQRMTLLSTMFCLAGLWAYCTLLAKATNVRSAFFALAALGFGTTLAFLCKENGALLPLLAGVLNITLLASCLESKDKHTKRFVMYACGIPSILVVAGIVYMGTVPNAYSSREFNLAERLMTESYILLDYLKQIVIPRLSGSGIYFDNYHITRSLFSPISTLVNILIIIASILFAFVFRARYTLISFAILWFFAGHIMESTFISLELYFEHRNYLPLLGPILAITATPFLLKKYKKIAFGFLAIWLSLLIIITKLQAPIWGNQILLALVWANENPNSVRATQELSRLYLELDQKQKALDVLLSASKKNPTIIEYRLNVLLLACEGDAHTNTETLLTDIKNSLDTKRYSAKVYMVLSDLRTYVQQHKCDHLINQTQWFELSELLLNNKVYRQHEGRNIHVERANFRTFQRDFNGTIKELEQAYWAQPDIITSQAIAKVLASGGLYDEAIVWVKRGMELDHPYFEKLIHNPKDNSIQLLKAIEVHTTKYPQANMNEEKAAQSSKN